MGGFPTLMNTLDRQLSCSLHGDAGVLVGPHAVNVIRHGKSSIATAAPRVNMTAQCQPGYYGDDGQVCLQHAT